jgi:glycosyltransferase involved in cell wall biosynthesis
MGRQAMGMVAQVGTAACSTELYEVPLTAEDCQTFPRILRRYTPAHLWHFSRQPRRRHRLRRQLQQIAERWRKSDVPKKDFASVLIVGPLSDTNGLSRAARYEVERITSRYPTVQTIDVRQETAESIEERIRNGQLAKPDILILLSQPDNYKLIFPLFEPDFLANAWRIGLLVWEMQYCPEEWQFLPGLLHEIWAPSSFAAEALAQGLRLPFEVRPHPVQVTEDPALDREQFGVPAGAFLGMGIMDLRVCPDRKNPLAHITAWQRAFGPDPRYQFLLKARFQKRTEVVRSELIELIAGYPNLRLLEDVFSDLDMRRFQRMADVYLSLHRSEGFGLNIKEMLELGTPVVATNWSAPSEYMSQYAHAFPVPYQLVPYSDFTRSYRHSSPLHWADPDIDEAARILRSIASTRKPASAPIPA